MTPRRTFGGLRAAADAPSVSLIDREVYTRLLDVPVFEVTQSPAVVMLSDPLDTEALAAVGLTSDRYLDRHHVIYDPADLGTRVEPERLLYELVAQRYEEEIDLGRNIRTIRSLLNMVGAGRVADYGCGTGIASAVADPTAVDLVGFDISPAMRARATERGMLVYPIEDLDTLPPGSFDGAFASYVLHLSSCHETLPGLLRLIREGGRFAANFHKGRGRDAVMAILRSAGFELESVHRAAGDADEPYVVWVSRRSEICPVVDTKPYPG